MECWDQLGSTLALCSILTLLIVLYVSMIGFDNSFKKWSILLDLNLGLDIINGMYQNWSLYFEGSLFKKVNLPSKGGHICGKTT